MKAEAVILQPGLFSTIQDSGRRGLMQYGVPLSGPMDTYAAGMANLLLQNPPGTAILEITLLGPKLRFTGATSIVITGAQLSPHLNGEPLENNKAYHLSGGELLSFGKRLTGCRAYLAVKGGFRTEKVLDSRSWYSVCTRYEKLIKGIGLEYRSSMETLPEHHSGVRFDNYLSAEIVETFKGPEYDCLSEAEKKNLHERVFSVDRNNNRMGIQLQESIENSLKPILTGPVLPGTVQLPPSGKPIVLMRDCQTTGGYPRILQLSEKGINKLTQKIAGDRFRFKILDR
ncbi:5-oxoprolinase subunit C family protein [Salinimicrobium flavum]|uniref:Biotin-dependent carboxyltransferase family protein n=1 Tax=Salinimicrobium flavum TaxID=1737065 RepID=A0ABW5IYA1_9FLAO